jgi:hypothetical protein
MFGLLNKWVYFYIYGQKMGDYALNHTYIRFLLKK